VDVVDLSVQVLHKVVRREARKKQARRRRDQVVDKMAAAYLLQGALDRLRNLR
jgi:RNase H-fold protein (predicted Holliday junction resolvase)